MSELIGKLIQRNYLEDAAKTEAKKFLSKNNITLLDDFIYPEECKKFQDEANTFFRKNNLSFECHFPDSAILLAFKKNGINKIFSIDHSFRECAKYLGIDSEIVLSLDSSISRKLREFYQSRKKVSGSKKRRN